MIINGNDLDNNFVSIPQPFLLLYSLSQNHYIIWTPSHSPC